MQALNEQDPVLLQLIRIFDTIYPLTTNSGNVPYNCNKHCIILSIYPFKIQ